ncbi:aquaporin Z [Iamia majanohamensis]|uniref:Aquaporin Z n=1 Tax=Iamia majanohamensis TaxID=467976 RepID=A0AAF0BSJ6_9ACTN|nr:aquaporin Z [Iamia majanohamensis]WCO65362.1 aquaporin Z [Iamia majanohamensis]
MDRSLSRRLSAEGIGTFWLVLGGCGTAVLAGDHVGFLGVALAFGLTVLTMAYAFGHISGGHFNPAVTLGHVLARRFPRKDVLPYMAAQVLGAVAAAAVLLVIANGKPDFASDGNFLAANGFGSEGSPEGYNFLAAAVVEVVLTFGFVMIILGATDTRAHPALAGLAIGLALTLIHLISIPVDNTSVNPARSIGPALFVGGTWLRQLWFFILAPLLGGGLAGLAYPALFGKAAGDTSAA